MSYTDDFRQYADICRADPANLRIMSNALKDSGLGEMLGWTPPMITVEGPPPPFPMPHEITAIQSTVWDNWPMGKPVKGFPSRYGMTIEVWTVPTDKIRIRRGTKPNMQFKTSCALMDSANLTRQIADMRRKSRAHPLDPKYLDTLEASAKAIHQTNLRIGMISTAIRNDTSGYNRGLYYHSNQSVLVEMDGSQVISACLQLSTDGEPIQLPPFSDRDASGSALPLKAVAQSRYATAEMPIRSWPTNEQ